MFTFIVAVNSFLLDQKCPTMMKGRAGRGTAAERVGRAGSGEQIVRSDFGGDKE